jgi:hypothetical protein
MPDNSVSTNRGDDIPCYELSLRDPRYGGRGGPLSLENLTAGQRVLQSADPKHMLLLVHGFNDTACAACDGYYSLEKILMGPLCDMGGIDPPDAIVCVQWPGDMAVLKGTTFLDFMGYASDVQIARDAAPMLANCLLQLAAQSTIKPLRVSIIAHSLGCRLMLETLRVIGETPTPDLSFEVVSLMAAAAPVALADGTSALTDDLLKAGRMPRALIKCYSPIDVVLSLGFPVMQAVAYKRGIEQAAYIEAIGLFGNPDALGSSGNSHDTWHSHFTYWEDEHCAKLFLGNLQASPPVSAGSRALPGGELPPVTGTAQRALPSRALTCGPNSACQCG